MLKKRKIVRNIVVLITIILILGIFINLMSLKTNVIEIESVAIDKFGYMQNEQFILEAQKTNEDLYEVELPSNINSNEVSEIAKVALINSANETISIEVVDNKIQLTKEQAQNCKLTLDVQYDIVIKQIQEDGTIATIEPAEKTDDEETKILYNKTLKHEETKKDSSVELKGNLPENTELQVEEVSEDKVKEIFGDIDIAVAYDIKILENGTSEINPQDFEEICNVSIKDSKISQNAEVYHVKDDGTYELVNVTETADGNISFEAQSFSVYGVTTVADDELIEDEGIEIGASSTAPTYIPTGYTYVTGTVDTGYVIQDSKGNQFVWIEVPRTTKVYSSSTLALDPDKLTSANLATIEEELIKYVSTYRPEHMWGGAYEYGYGDTWVSYVNTILSESKHTRLQQNMLKSIFRNGGFYIGRYETGTTVGRTSTSNTKRTPVIKRDVYPYNYVTPAEAQELSESFASGDYTSSLLFGLQWDLVMKYLQSNGVSKDYLKKDSSTWGNYYEAYWKITNENASWYSGSSWHDEPKGSQPYQWAGVLSTGASSKFKQNNIYDLAGNVTEYTLEIFHGGADPVMIRGGYCGAYGYNQPAYYRTSTSTQTASSLYGFRTALYINGDVKPDTTPPTVTITANKTSPTNASSITYTFTFSENVTGFTVDDVTVTNGTKGTFSGSGKTYTLVVTNSGTCTQTVKVAASKCTDAAGNANKASATKTMVIDRTAPTAGTMTMKYENASGSDYTSKTWTNQSIYLAVNNGSDAQSGHASTTYTVTKDGSAYLSNQTGTNTLTETGQYTIVVTTKDVAGNSKTRTYYVYIDKVAPTVGTMTLKYGNSEGSNYTSGEWTNQSIYLAVSNGTDTGGSGHSSTTYTVTKDGSEHSSNQTSAQTLTVEGKYTIVVTTTDVAGNVATATYYVYIDKTVPTAATLIMKLENSSGADYTGTTAGTTFTGDWTKQSIYIALNGGSDSLSDIKSITYSIDGGSAETSAKTLTSEGKYTIVVTTLDNAGNADTGTYIIKIDKTAPTVGTLIMKYGSATGEDFTSGNWTNQDIYIAVNNGSDTLSGHKSTTYTVKKDGVDYSINQTVEQILTEEGIYTITVTTTDYVEFTSTSEEYIVKIDKTAPTVGSMTLKYEDENGDNYTQGEWTFLPVYAELTDGYDESGGSGHKSTTYTVLKNEEEYLVDQEEPITISQAGAYTITVVTEDIAGNITTSNEYKVNIDSAERNATIEVDNGKLNPIYKPEWEIAQDENGENKVYIGTDSEGKPILTINLKGSSYENQTIDSNVTIDYASDVTSTLALEDITVYINGVDVTDETNPTIELDPDEGTQPEISTGTPSGKDEITHTIVLSNLEEASRRAGMPFKEVSGNIALKIKGRGKDSSTYQENVLVDDYGNQNMMETDQNGTNADGTWIAITFETEETNQNADGDMFADFIKPEFTYESVNTTIGNGNNGNTKKVTIIFDVTDQYFVSTDLASDDAENLITVVVDDDDVNSSITKTLSKKTIESDTTNAYGVTYKTNGDIYYTVNGESVKIGERYELLIEGLEQKDANGYSNGYSYSGPMTISFPSEIVIDSSDNENDATTITIGVDETDGNANTQAPEGGEIVDVVDPVWKLGDVDLDAGTIKLQAIDKYFSTTDIDEDDITVYVNGTKSTIVEKDITSTTPTNIYDTVSGVENTLVGKEYTLKLSNIIPEGGGYTGFEPTNKDTDGLIVDENGYAYYKSENGGEISIEIESGTITDQSGNINIKQLLDVGTIDVTYPEVYEIQKTSDGESNTETIVFNVTDRNYDSSDLVTLDVDKDDDGVVDPEITLFIDDVQVDDLINNATLTAKEIKGKLDLDGDGVGDGDELVLGHQYTLVISNIAQTSKQEGKDYLEWSGTFRIEIAEDASKDLNGNTLNPSTTTITDFVDFIKPKIEEIEVVDAISESYKTYTMSFTITDKYLDSSDLITESEIDVYVDGETADSVEKPTTAEGIEANKDKIWKELTSTPITATMNKTVDEVELNEDLNGDGTLDSEIVVNGTYIIGHTYTLELSNFEQSAKQTGKDFMEWSGTVTVELATTAVKDTTENTLDSVVANRTLGGYHVDFIKPVVENISSTSDANANPQTETIIFNIMDKYLDTDEELADTDITVYIDGEETAGLNMVLTKIQDFKHTVNGDATHVVGQQYQLVLSGFEQASRNDKDYKDWSGKVSIEINETAVKDIKVTNSNGEVAGGNTLDSAVAKRTILGDFVDFIKPDLKYTHSENDIDITNKKYTMTFDVTDKYYASGEIELSDLTITMQNGQYQRDANGDYVLDSDNNKIPQVYDLIALANSGEIDISFGAVEKKATFRKTVDGVVEETATSHVIGYTCTITIKDLQQLAIKTGYTTLDYSGVITVEIDENAVQDSGPSGDGTNPNKNDTTTITTGISIENGTESGTATEVDVVDPIWTKVSSSANAIGQTATITFKGTDTYFDTNTFDIDDIQVVINGTAVTDGSISKTLTSTTTLTEDRIENGENKTGVQYGVQYEMTITGFAETVNQVKIRIPKGVLVDKSRNDSEVTDLILYNVLKVETSDGTTMGENAFLGESVATTIYPENPASVTPIQRQEIERIEFVNGISGSKATGVQRVWDVSALGDDSIIAWTSNTEAPYTVYIGSEHEIFANQNSNYLFAYIGYASISDDTEVVANLDILNTCYVTSMDSIFKYCGYDAMTTLDLGSAFDTSNVTDMDSMFAYCGYKEMTALDLGEKFDTSNATTMISMFEACGYTKMQTLDLGATGVTFNTSKVTDMSSMFKGCGHEAMASLSLGTAFDTSLVTDMSYMFNESGYKVMTTLDLSASTNATNTTQFNTSSVIYMNNMFEGCGHTAMIALNLGNNFDTSAVTNMSGMFNSCGYTAMTSLSLGSKFNTINVTNMASMFKDCGYTAMTSLNLGSEFNTSSVQNMNSMFENTGFTLLGSLDLGDKFYTTSATNMTAMFKACGNSLMTVLDLGPAFTKISYEHEDFMTGCGTENIVIHAPESIYANRTSLKLNEAIQ